MIVGFVTRLSKDTRKWFPFHDTGVIEASKM